MRVSEVTLPLGRGGPFVRAPHSEVAKEGHHQEAAVVREEAGMSLLTPVMVQKPKLTEGPVNVTSLILTLPGLTNIQPELQMLKLEQLPQPDKLGGRLRLFAPNWRKISNDPEIIRIVQGYQISFNTIPDQRRPMTSPKFSQRERDLIDLEVAEMLKKGAISKAGYLKNQFVGHVFLREKKNNKFRLVFNLKPLNVHIKYEHFKMESMTQLTSIIQANDWMISIDLKDAYLCIPIHPHDHKFLRFIWRETLYQFIVMPFGLSPAPREFTRLLKPIVGILRRLGIRVLIYLDDLIIMNQDRQSLITDRNSALWLLQMMGFVISWEKSALEPTQNLEYLGFLIDSQKMTLSLPDRKVQDLINMCHSILREKSVTVRQLSKLIGKLNASVMAVLPAPLHYRHLQMQKSRELLKANLNYDSVLSLSADCREEISWWTQNLITWNGRAMTTPMPDLLITTDASMEGWGAHCEGVTTQGRWTQQEKLKHINFLELTAACFAVQAFTKHKQKLRVHLRADNTTTVAQINKMGGARSKDLMTVTKQLWDYCLSRQILLTAEYLPGVLNSIADEQSRSFMDRSNWMLSKQVFK